MTTINKQDVLRRINSSKRNEMKKSVIIINEVDEIGEIDHVDEKVKKKNILKPTIITIFGFAFFYFTFLFTIGFLERLVEEDNRIKQIKEMQLILNEARFVEAKYYDEEMSVQKEEIDALENLAHFNKNISVEEIDGEIVIYLNNQKVTNNGIADHNLIREIIEKDKKE